MHPLKRLFLLPKLSPSPSLPSQIKRIPFSTRTNNYSPPSSSTAKATAATGDDEWNDAWESAWLPDDPSSSSSRAPWESSDITLPSAATATATATAASSEIDADTKAFVAEMDERWCERRAARKSPASQATTPSPSNQKPKKKDADEYRVRKQRIHAGLWMKEIERMEESRVAGDPTASAAGDDIERLLVSASEIFDSGNIDLSDSKIPSTSEFKSKPDGWETTTKSQDGNIWEISQREEDILLQEFERRIAYSKFQIASFIKTHIFSRRRPIDGWKYMIEELGPNAKRGKGSVQRLPSLTDPSTQPFREERPAMAPNLSSTRGR